MRHAQKRRYDDKTKNGNHLFHSSSPLLLNMVSMDSTDGNATATAIPDLNLFTSSFPEMNLVPTQEQLSKIQDLTKSLLRRLANLSLMDYSWRSEYFKKTEADRRVEESLARMMGEDAAYVRPMDATDDTIGPLGRAEKKLVEWLSLVIEEEGRRAKAIASSDGTLVRPIDLATSNQGGPLSNLENATIAFLESIKQSELMRVQKKIFRPKDLEQDQRGPLGNAEASAVQVLDEIKQSEKLRMDQTRKRGGELVRPIDVPGPLGELERVYMEIITAEKRRGQERENNDGKLVRPKDAALQGPFGAAEREALKAIEVVKSEEQARLSSMQKVLYQNRPMEKNRESVLGWTEAIIIGILKAPVLLLKVFERVSELLSSATLPLEEQLDEKKKMTMSSSPGKKDGDKKNDFE